MNQTNRRHILWFVLLMVFSVFVRAYVLDFPLYHWDEQYDFNNVFFASFNHLKLYSYVHGSLHAYLILIIWKTYLFLTGTEPTTNNLVFLFFKDPTPLLVLARGWIALASTGTVAVVFLLAEKLYNKRVAWLSAILLAGTFLHVAESHYARAHTLSAFFVVLVLYFSKQILEHGHQRDYILAAISFGLAVACQYSLALVILPILYAHWSYVHKSGTSQKLSAYLFNRSMLISLNVAAITFFFVTPYALLDFVKFSTEIKYVLRDVTRVWVASNGQPIWLFYLTEHMRNGMGIALALFSLAGLVYAFIRHSQDDILLIIFMLASFITLAKSANFARYLIPSLPVLAILAASLLDRIFIFLQSRLSQQWMPAVYTFIVAGILAQSIVNIIRFDYWLTQPDTRQVAADWVLANIPSGSSIVVEGSGVLGPNIPMSPDDTRDTLVIDADEFLNLIYSQAMIASQPLNSSYTVFNVTRLDDQYGIGYLDDSVDSASYYSELGYDYLITSSWLQRDSTDSYSSTFQASLNEYYEPIKVFEPTIYFIFDPYSWRIDYAALQKVIPGQSGIAGPKLVVYKLRIP